MMKFEFEQMIGKEVSTETFEMYNAMYMAAPESVTKQKFVEMLNIKAIPESEEAIERRRKANELKQEIQNKIQSLKADIENFKGWIDIYAGIDKEMCRYYKDRITECKNEIASLKFVIA